MGGRYHPKTNRVVIIESPLFPLLTEQTPVICSLLTECSGWKSRSEVLTGVEGAGRAADSWRGRPIRRAAVFELEERQVQGRGWTDLHVPDSWEVQIRIVS